METKRALAALGALAQESRLAVFRLLVEHSPEGLTAGIIAGKLAISPATLSFHLKELAHAGLIASRQDGRFIWYRADFDGMNALVAYLSEKCCAGSVVCDPACAPGVAQTQPVLATITVASVAHAPRKRRKA
jgi:ArsR family transcriptional regulator